MAAYFLAEIESVHDEDMYSAYAMQVQLIVNNYGGEYLIRSDKLHPLGDGWQAQRIIVIRFDSMAKLQQCFQSPEYLAITPLRESSTISKGMIIED